MNSTIAHFALIALALKSQIAFEGEQLQGFVPQDVPLYPRAAVFWNGLADWMDHPSLKDKSATLAALSLQEVPTEPQPKRDRATKFPISVRLLPGPYLDEAEYKVAGSGLDGVSSLQALGVSKYADLGQTISVRLAFRLSAICISEAEVIRRFGGGPWVGGVDYPKGSGSVPVPGMNHRRVYSSGHGSATIVMSIGESGCLTTVVVSQFVGQSQSED